MAGRQQLEQLASLYGVQIAYDDVAQHRRQASPESLLLGLRALGAPVESLHDVPAALRERQHAFWQRGVEPVVVWEGGPATFELRLPMALATGALHCHLTLETGEVQSWGEHLRRLPTLTTVELEGTRYVVKQLTCAERLPWGYHRLTLETRGRSYETMVIAAPLQAYASLDEAASRVWGVFLPLYALHSQRSWGGGDLSDLEALMGWVADWGVGWWPPSRCWQRSWMSRSTPAPTPR